AGLADIRGGVTAAGGMIQRGSANLVATATLADIGLNSSTTRCNSITADPGTDGDGAKIECELIGNPRVNAKVVTLTRDASGQWECTSDIPEDKHKPSVCI